MSYMYAYSSKKDRNNLATACITPFVTSGVSIHALKKNVFLMTKEKQIASWCQRNAKQTTTLAHTRELLT